MPQRIVLVLSDPPLPFGSAVGRWYYVLLNGLVNRGHRVVTFAPCSSAKDAAAARDLFSRPEYGMRCYAHPARSGITAKLDTFRRPYSYTFSAELQRDVSREVSNGCDLLQLEGLWTGWVGLEHRDRAMLGVHYLCQIDLADYAPLSVLERARVAMALQSERFLLNRYKTICTLTPQLSARVSSIAPASRVHTVPLSLHLPFYPFDPRLVPDRDPVIGLIGSFDWRPTYSAAISLLDRLWPEIKRRVPNAKLLLAGRKAGRVFERCSGLVDVSVCEDVPDALPYFSKMDVLLYAPRHASGMKIKVLEAFALGVPVVTTTNGVEGIPAQDRVHADISDDDFVLIERTIALLTDRKLWTERRVRAHRLLEAHCESPCVLDALESVYASTIRSCSKPAYVGSCLKA
jgi:polysaccharide biosynthesis protein PslH